MAQMNGQLVVAFVVKTAQNHFYKFQGRLKVN